MKKKIKTKLNLRVEECGENILRSKFFLCMSLTLIQIKSPKIIPQVLSVIGKYRTFLDAT